LIPGQAVRLDADLATELPDVTRLPGRDNALFLWHRQDGLAPICKAVAGDAHRLRHFAPAAFSRINQCPETGLPRHCTPLRASLQGPQSPSREPTGLGRHACGSGQACGKHGFARMLAMSSTFDTVANIIAETCDIPRETIKPESHAINDLGIDSLDFLDIAFAIDKAFGIKLPLEKWTQEVNDGKATTEQYFVLKNLSARIDELVAAKGA
jgi:acyl carrier protein